MHPASPLLPLLVFIILCNSRVGHEGDEAHVEQVSDVCTAVLHGFAVAVTAFQIHLQQWFCRHQFCAHHTAVEHIQALLAMVSLVSILEFVYVALGVVWIFLQLGHHVVAGIILVLDVLLILAVGFVQFGNVDRHQEVFVLLVDALQFSVDFLEVLVQRMALFIQKALADNPGQGRNNAKNRVEGGSEGGNLLHAAQHFGRSFLDLCCISHYFCHVTATRYGLRRLFIDLNLENETEAKSAGTLNMKSKIRQGPVTMDKLLTQLMVLLGVLTLSYGAIQTPNYDDTPNPEFLNPAWMAGIPDDQPLSEVTMPGTHNTIALYGGVYAECQSWTLSSQLRAGVRFLDIRVRHVNGNLTLHHGVSYQRGHFGHVLEGVSEFLREYPSETVLMRLREEFSETNNIYGAVVDYIHRYAHWDLLWHSRLMPTMGEARGKLIVLQNFDGPDLGMRYDSLDIADDWKVPTLLHVEDKWRSVYNHLEVAPAGNKEQIFLTYSSGAGLFAYPGAVAQRINPQLYDYLTTKANQNLRFGIICMDFPAAPLIQMIIDFQLRVVEKNRQAFYPLLSKTNLKYFTSSLAKQMRKRSTANV